MEKLIVHGGPCLSGTVSIGGSKNASLPILAATLLTGETCVIRRVPDVSDTNYMLQILQNLGAEVERASGTVTVKAEKIKHVAPYELVRKMRASVCVMGPLMGRLKKADVSLPGGCVIGDRPVDLHLRGLEALGTNVEVSGGDMLLQADELVGAEIDMMGKFGSTVLGTDNVMMAAVLAKGTTVITGAAAEPEVVDLADFLNGMGAKISGQGTSTITIEGVDELGGVEHVVIPDRIEAGTFLVAGAIAAEKELTLSRVRRDHMVDIIERLETAGFLIEDSQSGRRAGVTIRKNPDMSPKCVDIKVAAYPGYPTDMQAQMSALFATTPGTAVIEDPIFPQRFMHLAEMKRMGADADIEPGKCTIRGVEQLSAAPVMASDLRASAALVLAGLTAKGSTEINRVYHIDRGYEQIDEKLISLGAEIERVQM